MATVVHVLHKRTLATSRCVTFAKKKSCADPLASPVAADMIGTPDPISNLRPVKYYVRPNEHKEERAWRLAQRETDEFNQAFWVRNNTMFAQAKAEYEQQLISRGEEATAAAMSVFYKDFLNKAYDRHMEYNRLWWKRNLSMLRPGFKAALRSLRRPPPRVDGLQTGFWDKSFES